MPSFTLPGFASKTKHIQHKKVLINIIFERPLSAILLLTAFLIIQMKYIGTLTFYFHQICVTTKIIVKNAIGD